MLFMKGNKMFPQCGFSNNAVQVYMKTLPPSLSTLLLAHDLVLDLSSPLELVPHEPFSVRSTRRVVWGTASVMVARSFVYVVPEEPS